MNKTLLFVTILFTVHVSSCKKDDNQPDDNNSTSQDVEIYNNVKVIDSTALVLNLTETNFTTGEFVFDVVGTPQTLNVNDIIVGTRNQGYIRKVTSVSSNGNKVVLQTTQGTMGDVFKQGNFSFNIDFTGLEPGKTDLFTYSINNQNIYQGGPLTIDLEQADLSISPNWLFNFSFDDGTIDFFEFSATNANFNLDAKVRLTATQQANLLNRTDILTTQTKQVIQWIVAGGIPVPVVVNIDLYWLAESSANISANLTTAIEANTNGNFTLGVKYENSLWSGLYTFSPNTTIDLEEPSGTANADFNFALRPLLVVKLYGIVGPRTSLALMGKLEGQVASPSLDWDFKAEAWGQATAGAEVTILGTTIAEYPEEEWNTSKLDYRMPFKMVRTSGDGQIGQANTSLQNPIKVQILDSENEPVSNVPVYFNVTTGGGSTNPADILTDTNGYAETTWTLGNPQTPMIQYVEVTAKFGDGTELNDAPVEFAATINAGCGGQTTFTDPRDGQTYNIVQIGNQCWFAENLNYAIGTSLCYDNNITNCSTYMRLYDWQTALIACPNGWHLPTDAEWTILTDYLGGLTLAGGKMKSTTGWNVPNIGATNSSGFSGLPGGYRHIDGIGFYGIGTNGYWWSSTEVEANTIHAWTLYLHNAYDSANLSGLNKVSMFSCRCVRD
ncbi:MAG: hypothetical protein H6603_02190 [Flavobacteriales bacterium]|nr:hypothetical protein [Flavobacteriales bacterium]